MTGTEGLRSRLESAPLDVRGRVLDASNAAFLAALDDEIDPALHVIYKPVAGERPLWDFPDGHLAFREVATSLVAAAGGWDLIPPTVLRSGPAGTGSVQLWVTPVPPDPFSGLDDDPNDGDDLDELAGPTDADLDLLSDEADPAYVQLLDPDEVKPPWLPVLSGESIDGAPIVLAHRDAPELRSLAVLDSVLNNSDRKGSHLLVGTDDRLWGIDHGLTFHAEDKLRTVLWGWAGERLPDADVERLDALQERLAATGDSAFLDTLYALLTVAEVEALRDRVAHLLRTRVHPRPSSDWPSVPWPPL